MLRDVEEIFDERQEGGRVRIEYDTKVYYGQLKRSSRTFA
jgi:hypothetical protein